MSACGACGADTPDGILLCTTDTDDLLDQLHAVPAVVADLLVTLTRQDNFRGTEKPVGKSTETPLPWNQRISPRLHELRNVLVLWAFAIVHHGQVQVPRVVDPHDPARIGNRLDVATVAARAITDHIAQARTEPRAGDLLRDVRGAVRAARRAVDRPADRRFLGMCSAPLEDGGMCEVDLYVHPKRTTAQCPGCDAEYDVEQRREVLLGAVSDQRVTYAEAERALPWLVGQPVKVSTLRNWVAERRLVPEGYRHAGTYSPTRVSYHDSPLLRVGDIVDEYVRVAREKVALVRSSLDTACPRLDKLACNDDDRPHCGCVCPHTRA